MTYHEKLFVIKIDAHDNTVWIGEEKYLFHDEVKIIETQLLSELEENKDYQVKIRYQHQGANAKLIKNTQGGYTIKFREAQRAITPGQAAVIYQDKKLIGGGWITLQ